MKEQFKREEVLKIIKLILKMPEELKESFANNDAESFLENAEDYLFE